MHTWVPEHQMQVESIKPDTHDPRQTLPPPSVIFGSTVGLRMLREKLENIADTSIPVLVEGESGVGKEVIAKYLHEASGWANGPFIKIPCAACGGEVFETEHDISARGFRTVAPESTLFLDDLAELDRVVQSKLLQAIQHSGCCLISRGGRTIQARLICATSHSLEDEIKAERFRHDLFYRLNGARMELPPLRKRMVDVPTLADYFVELYNQQFKRRVRPLSTAMLNVLSSYSWPGNVRELENFVRRYVLFGNEEAIRSEFAAWEPKNDLSAPSVTKRVGLKELSRQAARNFEAELITKVLDANHWNRKQAARTLNISYRALLYKLKEAGIRAR